MDHNEYQYIGEFNISPVGLEGESDAIPIPADFAGKRCNFVLQTTHDQAVSLRLHGGLEGGFTTFDLALESALALTAGNVTPQDGLISTEYIFPFYKVVGTSALPAAPAGRVKLWFAMFD